MKPRRRGGRVRARARERRYLLRNPGVRALMRAAGCDVSSRSAGALPPFPLAALREGAARWELVCGLVSGAAGGEFSPSVAPQISYGFPRQALPGFLSVAVPPPGAAAKCVSELMITDVSRLALPAANVRPRPLESMLGEADVAELRPFLQGPLRREHVPSRMPRACLLVAADQLAPLYFLLWTLGMLRFDGLDFPVRDGRNKPVYNGCFWTPKKGDRMRLLLDMRPGNEVGVDPPDPRLPGPDSLPVALAYLEHRGVDTRRWSLCAEDSKNCFHRMAAGAVAERHQCLPPISADTRRCLLAMGVPPSAFAKGGVPVIVSLAMGNKWSVVVAQTVMRRYVARTCALLPHVVYSSIVVLPYIDDLHTAGDTRLGYAREFMVQYRQLMEADGWELCDDKRQVDAIVGDVLGVSTDFAAGAAALSVPRLAVVTTAVRQLLASPLTTPRQVREVVGSLVWGVLVKRPLLSFFLFVFRWMAAWGRRGWDTPRRLARSVRAELDTIVHVLPFAVFHFRSVPRATVISDACTDGGAAGVSDWVPAFASDCPFLHRSKVAQGFRPPMRFPSPASTPFDFVGWAFEDDRFARLPGRSGSIAHKELFALLIAVLLVTRRAASSVGASFSYVMAYNDNMTTVSIVQKGRSRSFLLNRTLRRVNALCVLWGIHLVIDYIYSELNPADGPSRDAGLRRHFRFPAPYIASTAGSVAAPSC